jgi:hypothetical protein
MANLVLLIVIVIVAATLLLLKTNAAAVFFSLCSGDVLVQFANKNMAYLNGKLDTNLLPKHFTVTQTSTLMVILLAPPILVALLLKGSSGMSKWPIQIFPAIATGIMGSLLVVPLLSLSTQTNVTNNKVWTYLEQYQVPVVGLCVLVSIVAIAITVRHHASKSHHKMGASN